MSSAALLDAWVIAVGLAVGSYLNVLVHRLPRGLSTLWPRSRCPRCRNPVRGFDNVPVLSFLLLRGRCRDCGAPIAWRYPLLEALAGAGFFLAYRLFEPLWPIVVAAGFAAAMLALAMIDLEHLLLPDAITLPGLAAGLLLVPLTSWTAYPDAWLGAVLGGGLLWAVSWIWYRWRGVHGMGFGDVKMLAMIGAFLGWRGVVTTLFVATLGGSAVGLVQVARGRMSLRSKLPFGLFLAIGALATLFGRDALWRAYDRAGLALVELVYGPLP